MAWYVYIVECVDSSLYTGITTDVERRTEEHNRGRAAARYTRAKRPVKVVYVEDAESRSTASKREWALKKMSRAAKLQLINKARLQREQEF